VTPARLDPESVERRLRALADALADLEQLRGATSVRLDTEPLTRAAAERLVQVVVDLAIDVNAHIAAAHLHRAPATARQSFLDAATVGAIDASLAALLAPTAGLRNVLVHRYIDIDSQIVAAAIDVVLDGYADYLRSVARWLGSTDAGA